MKVFFEKLLRLVKTNWLFIVILLYFLAKGLELIFTIGYGVAPDEGFHFVLSQIYKTDWGIANNTVDTFRLGQISNTPYLYHYVLGKWLILNRLHIEDLTWLRFFNLGMFMGTLTFAYLAILRMFKNRYFSALAVFCFGSIPMISFLSPMVNYDNLVLFSSVAATHYFLEFIDIKDPKNILLTLVFLLIGTLTKISLLPLLLAFLLWIVIMLLKREISIKKLFIEVTKKKFNYFLTIVVTILVVLNGILYLGNIVKYKDVKPDCEQVLVYEDCLLNPVFKRNEENIMKFSNNTDSEIDPPLHYAFYWLDANTSRLFGVFGHQVLLLQNHLLEMVQASLILFLLVFVYKYKFQRKDINFLVFSFLFYVLILMFYFNYSEYIRIGVKSNALQGRYLFPIIFNGFLLILFTIDSVFKRLRFKILSILLLSVFMFYIDYIHFSDNITKVWLKDGEVTEFFIKTKYEIINNQI